MVRRREKGVLSTNGASVGRSVYCMAFDIVIGRTAVAKPPRMPAMQNGVKRIRDKRHATLYFHLFSALTFIDGVA